MASNKIIFLFEVFFMYKFMLSIHNNLGGVFYVYKFNQFSKFE